jgi:hypothetical protein
MRYLRLSKETSADNFLDKFSSLYHLLNHAIDLQRNEQSEVTVATQLFKRSEEWPEKN